MVIKNKNPQNKVFKNIALALGVFLFLIFALPNLAEGDEVTLRPDANGYYQEWETLVGDSHWEATSDGTDATYIQTYQVEDRRDIYDLKDPAFSDAAEITNIRFWVRCRALGGGGPGEKLTFLERLGETERVTGSITAPDDTFGDREAGRTDAPGGIPWTKDNITALQIGVECTTLGSGETLQVSEIWIVVTYTPPVAVERWWQGVDTVGSDNWSNPDMWDPVGVPVAGDLVSFDESHVGNCTIDVDTANLDVFDTHPWGTGYTGTITLATLKTATFKSMNLASGTSFIVTAGTDEENITTLNCYENFINAGTFTQGSSSLLKVGTGPMCGNIETQSGTFTSTGTVEWCGDYGKYIYMGSNELCNLVKTGSETLWLDPVATSGTSDTVITGNFDLVAGSFIIREELTVQGTLTISDGAALQLVGDTEIGATLEVSNDIVNNGNAADEGLVLQDATYALTIKGGGGITLNNIDFNAKTVHLDNIDVQVATILDESGDGIILDSACEFDAITIGSGATLDTGGFNITTTGPIDINTGGTLTAIGSETITMTGNNNLVISGTFNEATSTVDLQGTGEIQADWKDFYNLTCGASGKITTFDPITDNSGINVYGTLTVGAGTLDGKGATGEIINLKQTTASVTNGGIINISDLTFEAGTTHLMSGGDYSSTKIRILSGAAVTLTGDITHSGIWIVGAGDDNTTSKLYLGTDPYYNITSSSYIDVGENGQTSRVGQIICGAGSITATSNLYVYSGYNSNDSATNSIDLGSGTHSFGGSVTVDAADGDATATLTLSSATTTVSENFINNGTVNESSSSLLQVAGHIEMNLGTFTKATGTVEWNGSAEKHIWMGSNDLYNLTTSGSSTLYTDPGEPLVVTNNFDITGGSFGAKDNVTVEGVLTIDDNAAFKFYGGADAANIILTVSNDIVNNGNADDEGLVLMDDSVYTLTIASVDSALKAITNNNIDFNTKTVYLNKIDIQVATNLNESGDAIILSGDCEFDAITVGAGATLTDGSYNLTTSGNFDISNGTAIYTATGTLTLNGTTDQTITTGGTGDDHDFNNIVINNTGIDTEDDIIIVGNLDIDGNLTITNGDFNGEAINISVVGDWSNSSTFTCGTSTVTFDGAAAQEVTTGGSDWNAMEVTNASVGGVSFADEFTTNTFTCETPDAYLYFVYFDADNGPPKTFLINTDGGLVLNGADGQTITLDQYGGVGGTDQFEICPTGGNPVVTWVTVSNSVNSAADYINPANSAEGGEENTTNWFSASLVNLVLFRAIGYPGKVELMWETASEINNAGFNLYRAEEGSGDGYVKLNAQLIPGLGTSVIGQTYTYTDSAVTNGKTYRYILEDVETTGKTTKHGPVIAHPGLDTDGDGMSDDWEYYYGLNPYDPNDADLDPDNDGLTNLEEFLAGTNPNVIDSEDLEDGEDGIKITYLDSGDIELELNTSVFVETLKAVNGITYQIITIPTYNHAQNDEIGKPLVPVKGILLGVDYKKDLVAELLESVKESYSDYLLYPVEKVVMITDPESNTVQHVSYEFYKDENAYAQNTFYPGKLYDVDYSGYLRDNLVVKVEFFPIQFNPVSGELEFYKKIKLRITLPEAEEKEVVLNEKTLPFTGEENYKIYIEEEGIYKITGQDLEATGIDLAQINTDAIGLYHKDKQIPAVLVGLEDGVFGPQDYIQFYAEAIDNYYTNENIYWLNFNSTSLAMAESLGFEGEALVSASFLKKIHLEENALYWIYQESMGQDHWFYPFFLKFPEYREGDRRQDISFTTDNLASVNSEVTLRVALQGIDYYNEEPPHHIYFHLNANFIGEDSWQGNEQHEVELNFNSAFLSDGTNTLNIELPGDTGWNYEKALLNWIEVIYNRGFQVTGDSIAFSHNQSEAATFELTGFSSSDIAIFDITDPQNPIQISNYQSTQIGATYTISFKDAGLKNYIATTSGNFKTPKKIIVDEVSDLRSTENRADYIIICAPEFYETIQTFANYRTQRGLVVTVVKLEDIYDEFNYGISEPDTIKDFLKYAYYNWQEPIPTYVLLVGDASYDYRNYYGFGYLNYVPTHMLSSGVSHETGSDNWFVCFDGEEDTAPEMLIGRFPVKTNEQLEVIINKIQDYEALNADAEWAKKVLLVADDDEEIFTDISNDLNSYLTDEYTSEKLYLEGFAGTAADFKDNLISKINEGALILNYTGHGSIQLWADESIMTNSDLDLLYNAYQLPLVNMYTCMSGYFVYPKYYESLAEEFLTKDGGGAIAVIASGGLTTPGSQKYLAEGIFREFFLNGDGIVGSIFTQAKLYLLENVSSKDAINVIQTFNLFGDPALSLKKQAEEEPEEEPEQTEETSSEQAETTATEPEQVEETLSEQTTEETEQTETAVITETERVETTSEDAPEITTAETEQVESNATEEQAETGTISIAETNQIIPPVYAISSEASSSGLVELTQLSSGAKGKAQKDIKAKSRGAKGARTKDKNHIQIAKGTEGDKIELTTLEQEPAIPEIKPKPVQDIIGGNNIRRLYRLANQKNQKITTLVRNYKDALKLRDYDEASFRIRLIFRIFKEKE